MIVKETEFSITPQWMTDILRKRGLLNNGEVKKIESVEEIKRYVSKSYFFSLQYTSPNNKNLSDKFFLKVYDPGLTEELVGKKEVQFYETFPAVMEDFHFIDCYASLFDEASQTAYLLFPDVQDEVLLPQQLDKDKEPSRDQFKRVIRYLSRFHVYWWDHQGLGRDIGSFYSKEEYDKYIQLNKERYHYFRDLLKHRLEKEKREILEKIIAHSDLLYYRLLSCKNITICHGDTNIYNILWPLPESDKLYLVDWNYWQINLGAMDLAYLLSLTLNPVIREALQEDLLHFYYNCLLQYGIKGYSWHDFIYDYKLSLSMILFTPIALCSWKLPFLAWYQQYKNSFAAYENMNCREILP